MLEKNSPKPLYQQLKDILVDAIDSEKWKANEKIPSENELSSIYGLSRMTVRSVLTDLVKEGLLYRVQGKGTFVAEKIVTVSPSYIGIREQLEKMGYEVETRIVECQEERSSETVAKSSIFYRESLYLRLREFVILREIRSVFIYLILMQDTKKS